MAPRRGANSKLTDDQVKKIRQLHDPEKGRTQVWLAKKFKVSQTSISFVLNNKSYRHI